MKWSIPAKTFLVGEYAALVGAPGILLTTSPCFELALTDEPGLQGIHPESPAGQWWAEQGPSDIGLQWVDPYHGCGGLGASSAQFLGCYFASLQLQNKTSTPQALLAAYLQYAWQGKGLPPSGYDVIAQSLHHCVYINKQHNCQSIYTWPFQDLSFLLLHTGKKLATHHHLQAMELPNQVNQLITIVLQAKQAFEQADSHSLVNAVNAYHQQLARMDLVAEHSLELIESLQQHPDILAAKGCGAMGSDILLLLVSKKNQTAVQNHLSNMGWTILATHADLYTGQPML